MLRVKLIIFSLAILVILSACADSGSSPQSSISAPDQPTRVVVRILNLDAAQNFISTSTSTVDALQLTPVVIEIITPVPTLPSSHPIEIESSTPTPSCTNRAEFVKHLTISDGTALSAGQPFGKVWQVKNIGTCTWTTDYALVFYSGEAMSGPESAPIPTTVSPGDLVDLHIDLVTPLVGAASVGNWVLRDDKGNMFGVGPNADQSISVAINIKPTPRPTPG